MSDPLDQLFDDQQPLEAPAPATAPEPAQPAITPEASQAGTGELAAPPVAEPEKPAAIPISALLDEREKRQAAERQAQEYQRKIAEFEAAQKPKPDFFDNPDAAIAAERAQVQKMLWNERLNMSEMLARQAHGDDTVTQAAEAFAAAAKQNPALAFDLQRQPDPYGHVVAWHKKQVALSKIGDDPDAYIERMVQERIAAAMASQSQPAPVQTSRPAPTMPPRSMASAPSVGSAVPRAAGSAFDQVFGG